MESSWIQAYSYGLCKCFEKLFICYENLPCLLCLVDLDEDEMVDYILAYCDYFLRVVILRASEER